MVRYKRVDFLEAMIESLEDVQVLESHHAKVCNSPVQSRRYGWCVLV